MALPANDKTRRSPPPLRWHSKALSIFVKDSLKILRARKKVVRELSPWWSFIHAAAKDFPPQIASFIAGTYHFEPMVTYKMSDETMVVWQYADRLFVRALLYLIKPLFKYIISPNCFHLQGPSGVKNALRWVQKALEQNTFRYFLRVDVKGYYASIDRKILVKQMQSHFDDPRVRHYLESIITIPMIENGAIYTPLKGIARRSSLSPFFGALYLSPLDQCFEKAEGICYSRYMDDIVILAKTKRQFCRAKKRLAKVLAALRLQCSRRKTKVGVLTKGFHFLGVDFKVNALAENAKQTEAVAQTQLSETHVNLTLHERSCVRALDKVIVMKEDAVHPAKIQRYLSRWATWWSRAAAPIRRRDCLQRWVKKARIKHPGLAWLGSGLCGAYGVTCRLA